MTSSLRPRRFFRRKQEMWSNGASTSDWWFCGPLVTRGWRSLYELAVRKSVGIRPEVVSFSLRFGSTTCREILAGSDNVESVAPSSEWIWNAPPGACRRMPEDDNNDEWEVSEVSMTLWILWTYPLEGVSPRWCTEDLSFSVGSVEVLDRCTFWNSRLRRRICEPRSI